MWVFVSGGLASGAEPLKPTENEAYDLSAVYNNAWVEKNRHLFQHRHHSDPETWALAVISFALGLLAAFLFSMAKKYRIWNINSTLVNLDGLNCRQRAQLHTRWGARP